MEMQFWIVLGGFGKTKMRDLGCWSTENTAKTSVLDQLYAQKRVNFLVFEENIETTLQKPMFWTAFVPKHV